MNSAAPRLLLPKGELEIGRRTLIMGVINVTPDSFSDGGWYYHPGEAVAQGLRLAQEGADILDVGGESTRPGSEAISAREELGRVMPVIKELIAATDKIISIDTTKAEVAEAALEAGASIINDVSALRGDPQMAELAAAKKATVILMHMLGEPKTMQENPTYGDVVGEVRDFLAQRLEFAVAAGIERERIVLDPGIGFGKTKNHNLLLIRHLEALASLGRPVMLGASRKAFLGLITGRQRPADRLWGTVGVHVLGAVLGAHLVRVHDVAPVREALMVCDQALRAEPEP